MQAAGSRRTRAAVEVWDGVVNPLERVHEAHKKLPRTSGPGQFAKTIEPSGWQACSASTIPKQSLE